MVALDTRSRDILSILLKSPRPMASSEIAQLLNITPRMVRYSLRGIEIWLHSKEIAIHKIPGSGLSIDIPASKREEIISELDGLSGYSLILSPQERVQIIVLSLLTQEMPLLIKQMALKLGVSRPTALKDMDKVELWLSEYDISLERRPGFGFKIHGSEWNFRKATEALILDIVGEISLLAFCQGKQKELLSGIEHHMGLTRYVSVSLEQLELSYCRELVEVIEGMSQIRFSDNSYISLLLFLSILIERTKKGNFVELSNEQLASLQNESEYKIANGVGLLIDQRIDVQLKPDEIAYITARLMGIKARRSFSGISGQVDADIHDEEHIEITREMISEASKLLHPYLNIDPQLFRGLSMHIKPVLNRLRFNQMIRNRLLDEIKSQYPYVYKVAERSCQLLEDKLGHEVPEEEVGFIAMHFGAAMERLRSHSPLRKKVLVVCGGGIATAWMLVSRIQAELPEIEVVEVTSALEVLKNEVAFDNLKAIITTVPIEIDGMPVILVSPLLNDDDKNKIQEILGLDISIARSKRDLELETGFSITSLITPDTLQIGIQASTWQEVVSTACQPLVHSGLIHLRYAAAIKSLLEKHGPYMVLTPGVALLHAMPGDGVRQVCMGLSTLQHPVNFGNPFNDPVSIAIVFGSVDGYSHLRALAQLARLLDVHDVIDTIRQANTKDTVIDVMRNSFFLMD